ncbi:MAG: DUF1064 domain-containing protein [Novosphingobium sp.]|nr:DUF1064 domain-containing protein [Novosphingobium sp.]
MKKNGKKTLNQISRKKNVKVKNATPMTCDGIKFRSKLEVYCYKKLLQNNIKADYEIQTFTVLESFKYLNEVIRKITYTPDFIGEEFIIECKGMMNDAFPLRYKLFKYFLFKNGLEYDLYLPRNQKDVDKMIVTILDKRNNAQ